ncbi:MAG: polysulfide reductase NrfD, partial [Deltaproteobacteria bacterium]|nr:polysulfide reductase NrfD [Deltaproteobacteria bacterium]MBI2988365.1 polysulfide reductase NrfD [Deltaproteobacteria bacterium]
VKLLTQGELRSWFLIGFMVLGVAFPFMLVVVGYFLEGLSGSPLLLAIGILALLGVFAQRYCLLKAGIKPALI